MIQITLRSTDSDHMENASEENARSSNLIEEAEETVRNRYLDVIEPLFFPDEPAKYDIVSYFSSLLRVVGMEGKGWDPYAESKSFLDDIYALMQLDLPEDKFPDRDMTVWRLGLNFYNHIIEMDAPYEVLANLLRYRLGKGYSPNPFYDFLDRDQKKRFKKQGLFPSQKIDVLRKLGDEAELPVGDMFDEFFRPSLRNAISHSDFIITDEEFRSRNGYSPSTLKIPLVELNDIIRRAKFFIGSFFAVERECRRFWGVRSDQGIPYDPAYKGLMEVLADADGFMNGFKVHWPNQSESYYQRTPDGVDMVNCYQSFERQSIELFVGLYARVPGDFSPLVERDSLPVYTPLRSGKALVWPDDLGETISLRG